MSALHEVLEAFRQDLRRHLLSDPNSRAIDCEACLAEDGRSVLVIAALTNGTHICSALDLAPDEIFGDQHREFIEISFAVTAAVECEFFIADGASASRYSFRI